MVQGSCVKHMQLSARTAAQHIAPCLTYSVCAMCLALLPHVTESDLQVVSQCPAVMQSWSHRRNAWGLPYGAC